jgi:hypothetical protein
MCAGGDHIDLVLAPGKIDRQVMRYSGHSSHHRRILIGYKQNTHGHLSSPGGVRLLGVYINHSSKLFYHLS